MCVVDFSHRLVVVVARRFRTSPHRGEKLYRRPKTQCSRDRPPRLASPARSRWWKNVWNLPFSGISVSMGGITVDRIVNDPSLRRLAYRVMDETIAIANADLRRHGSADDELLGEETVSPTSSCFVEKPYLDNIYSRATSAPFATHLFPTYRCC